MWLVLLEAEREQNYFAIQEFCLANIRECLQLHLVPLVRILFQ